MNASLIRSILAAQFHVYKTYDMADKNLPGHAECLQGLDMWLDDHLRHVLTEEQRAPIDHFMEVAFNTLAPDPIESLQVYLSHLVVELIED